MHFSILIEALYGGFQTFPPVFLNLMHESAFGIVSMIIINGRNAKKEIFLTAIEISACACGFLALEIGRAHV